MKKFNKVMATLLLAVMLTIGLSAFNGTKASAAPVQCSICEGNKFFSGSQNDFSPALAYPGYSLNTSLGSRYNSYVYKLQLALVDLAYSSGNMGLHPGKVDGYFGPITEMAVKAFQDVHNWEDSTDPYRLGLTIDGRFGPASWEVMQAHYYNLADL